MTLSPQRLDEAADLCGCESCQNEFPIESMTMMCDNWFCEEYTSEWRKIFDACEHEWSRETSHHGEADRYCSKCGGFVCDEDLPLLSAELTERDAG